MTQDELKALIEDLRLNHEYCPKEVILQAADELERLAQPEQEPVALEQERKAFEEWIDSGFINKGHAAFHKFSDRDAYCIDEIQNKWKAWKERAKRTSPPPQRTEPVIDQSAAIRIATALGWTPPRPWVGLTDEEIQWVYDHGRTPAGMMEMIEAKRKQKIGYAEEKNT